MANIQLPANGAGVGSNVGANSGNIGGGNSASGSPAPLQNFATAAGFPFPLRDAPLMHNSVYATASPAAGDAEWRAVQQGGCYYDWPFQFNNCNSCQWCPRGPAPAGYPFGPYDAVRNEAAAYPPVIPPSGTWATTAQGACKPYGRTCTVGPRDWLAPTGARSVKIAPGIWTVLPNQVPPAVSINAYYHGNYIEDIYANRHGKFRGCDPGRAGLCKCTAANRAECPQEAIVLEPRTIRVPQGYALQPPQ